MTESVARKLADFRRDLAYRIVDALRFGIHITPGQFWKRILVVRRILRESGI